MGKFWTSIDINLELLPEAISTISKAYLIDAGTESKRMVMAKTLSDIQLSDQIKLCLAEEGALKPLLELLSQSNIEMKSIAIKALQNLATVPENGQLMIKEGVSDLLFELLFCHTLSTEIRENVAATIMLLAISKSSQGSEDEQVTLLESHDDIFKLFSLVSLTGSNVQKSILRIFQAMCQSPAGSHIRTKLRQVCRSDKVSSICLHKLAELNIICHTIASPSPKR